jgi:hypothetical protein
MPINPPFGTKAHSWLADIVRNFAKMGHGFEIPQQSHWFKSALYLLGLEIIHFFAAI